jgi:hypothetical protein
MKKSLLFLFGVLVLFNFQVPLGQAQGGPCELTALNDANLRDQAGLQGQKVDILRSGRTARAIAQSEDDQQWTWWQLENGFWVREDGVSENGPCQSLPQPGQVADPSGDTASSPNQSSTASEACNRFPIPLRLSIGGQGVILPGDPNLINTKPARPSLDSSSQTIGRIESGEVFNVLGGPVCNHEIAWWWVEFEGIEGWTGEAMNSTYWAEPYGTIAAPASPEASPPQDNGILHQEDFSQNTFGWETANTSRIYSDLRDGRYVIEYSPNSSLNYWVVMAGYPNYTAAPIMSGPYDLQFEVHNFNLVGNDYRLVILLNVLADYESFLMLQLSSDGQVFLVENGSDGNVTDLYEGRMSRNLDLSDGQPQLIRVAVRPNTYQVSINGALVAEVPGVGNIRGTMGLGLHRHQPGTTYLYAEFDNLFILSPDGQAPTLASGAGSANNPNASSSPGTAPNIPNIALSEAPTSLNGWAIAYQDDFQDNAAAWGGVVYPFIGGGDDYRSNVSGGQLFVEIAQYDSLIFLPGAGNAADAPVLIPPYEVSVDMRVIDPSSDSASIDFILGGRWNNQGEGLTQLPHLSYYRNLERQKAYISADNMSDDAEGLELPLSELDLFNGQTYRINLQVLENVYILSVNGQEIYRASHQNEPGANTGAIGFGLRSSEEPDFGQSPVLSMAFANLFVYQDASITAANEAILSQGFPAMSPYEPEALAALAEDPRVYAFSDFESERPRWARGELEDGQLRMNIPADGRVNFAFSGAQITSSYTAEVEISEVVESGGGVLSVGLEFNGQNITTQTMAGLFTEYRAHKLLLINGQRLYYNVGRAAPEAFPLGLDLADGGRHRVKFLVEQGIDGFVGVIYINEQEVLRTYIELTSQVPEYAPFYTEIGGEITFFIGAEGDSGQVSLLADNFILQAYRSAELAAGTGLGELTESYVADNGRLRFQHPAGWVAARRPDLDSRGASNEDVYLQIFYNSEQGLTGGPNEIAIAFFDPALAIEIARLPDPLGARPEELLEAFTINNSGQESWDTYGPAIPIQVGDRTMWRIGTEEFFWLAFESSDGYTSLMQIVLSSGQAAELSPTALAIAATADYPAPSRDLDQAEEAIYIYTTFAHNLQLDSAINSSCLEDSLTIQLAGLFLSDLGDQGALLFDPIINLEEGVNFTADTSGLFFDNVTGLSGNRAIVRVIGSVTRYYDDGQVEVVEHDGAFGSGYDAWFGEDAFALSRSGGLWLRCSGAFTFGN